MSTPIFISRNFVEFGPFLSTEILDFHGRGILGDLDHVREDGQDEWLFITEWVEKVKTPAPKAAAKPKVEPVAAVAPAAPIAAPAAKKAAVKAPAAKKAAAKKTK